MRLWSLHPKYLDAKGLVALWREGLLAQAVLKGQTRGYTRHPQLQRFQQCPDPIGALSAYLRSVLEEALQRGYRFDESKIAPPLPAKVLEVTRGQLLYEWRHLTQKLQGRDPAWLERLQAPECPEAHPLFRITEGAPEPWEVLPPPGGDLGLPD